MTPAGARRTRRRFAASGGQPHTARRRSRTALSMPSKARRERFPARPRRFDWKHFPTVVSSLAAVAALIFTGLSLQATRQQISIDAQGEVTSRFTAAVSQLSSSDISVRSGAIITLGSIAHDSAYWQPGIITLLSGI